VFSIALVSLPLKTPTPAARCPVIGRLYSNKVPEAMNHPTYWLIHRRLKDLRILSPAIW
jgi:hypothetical protein